MCYNIVMLTIVLARKVRFIMNMETKNVIEKIKKAVHQPLNFDDFKSSCTRENTNCFALAIGSTVTADKTLYRIGRISDKKPLDEKFFSIEEVKDLFLADLQALNLRYESLDLHGKSQILAYTSGLKLEENEHIVVMFVQKMANNTIMDYHFLRYDNRGWSEIRRQFHQFVRDDDISWPSNWYDNLVGCYKITR